MTEKAKKSTKIDRTDPKYIARRAKNKEAVKKCRLKKAFEEEQRQKYRRKLQERNNYLEGQIRGLRRGKKLFMELLIEQAKRTGRELTQEQKNLIGIKDSSSSGESSDESSDSSSSSSSSASSSDSDNDKSQNHRFHHNRTNEMLQRYTQSTDYR